MAFALPHRFVCAALLGHIRVRPDPFADRTVLMVHRYRAHAGPSVLAVGTAHAVLHFVDRLGRHAGLPNPGGADAIVGVKRIKPADPFPFVVSLTRKRPPAWRVVGDRAVGGTGPDHLAARDDQGAEALLGQTQRFFRLDALADVLMHEHDLDNAASGIRDRLSAPGDPARPGDDAQFRRVVPDRRDIHRFAGKGAQQVSCDALGLELWVGQQVVTAVQNVFLQRIAQRALPHRFPCLVHLQRAAVGGQQLHADRGLVEDFTEPDV